MKTEGVDVLDKAAKRVSCCFLSVPTQLISNRFERASLATKGLKTKNSNGSPVPSSL